MQRYFVKRHQQHIIFEQDDIFHITKVMRVKKGDAFEVVDQQQALFLVETVSLSPFEVKIVEQRAVATELTTKLTLYYVMAKGDKTDFVIQKATELGVNKIVLLQSSRSVIKIDDGKSENKLARFQKIAKEASEQSKRLIIPTIEINADFKSIGKDQSTLKMIADEEVAGLTKNLYSLLDAITTNQSIALLVGPEGGFSRQEVEYVKINQFIPISLGKRILRSETAAIHFVGVVASYLERQ